MKILQVVNSLEIGGMQRFVLDLSQELAKRHEVCLCTLYGRDHDGLPCVDPKFERVALEKHPGLDLGAMWKLRRLVHRRKFDIVHTHMMALLYAAPAVLGEHLKKRCVHTLHSVANHECNEIDWLKRILYGRYVVPVSISDEVLTSLHVRWPKVDSPLIYNGAEKPAPVSTTDSVANMLKRYKKTSQTRVCVNLASIDDNKNQSLLNEVAARLEKERADVVFLVAGNVRDRQYHQEILARKAGNLHFVGSVRDVGSLLEQADFFCLPSKYEGLPISLLEAMSCGCLPVCTPVSGVRSVLRSGENGLVAKDFSADAYAEILRRALNLTPDESRRMRQQAVEDYRARYSMEICAKHYEELYAKLCRKS